jgi:hypothetical protein
VLGIFKMGSLKLFPQVGFELQSSRSLPRIIGVSHMCLANKFSFSEICYWLPGIMGKGKGSIIATRYGFLTGVIESVLEL